MVGKQEPCQRRTNGDTRYTVPLRPSLPAGLRRGNLFHNRADAGYRQWPLFLNDLLRAIQSVDWAFEEAREVDSRRLTGVTAAGNARVSQMTPVPKSG
jgi:hypothetical protein